MLDLLDTFIGLVTIYLILSLIATAIGEGFSTHLNLRGAVVLQLLESTLGTVGATKFRQHRNFLEICEDQGGSVMGWYNAMQRRHGWLNVLPNDKGSFPAVPPDAQSGEVHYYRAASYLACEVFVATLLELVVAGSGEGAAPAAITPMAVDRALAAPPAPGEPEYLPKLRQLWKEANYDLPRFEEALRRWFMTAGERSHGWFKRDVGFYVFVMSLGIAGFLNADTLYMFRMLTEDEGLREQYVETAMKLSELPRESLPQAGSPDGASLPDYDILNPQLADAICDSAGVNAGEDCTKHLAKALLPTVLPVVGWDALTPPLSEVCWKVWDDTCNFRLDVTLALVLKLAGLFLTAAAISFGAPFWFDLLQKMVRVRGTVRGDEKPAATVPAQNDQPIVANVPRAKSLVAAQALAGAELESLDQFHDRVFGFDLLNNYWTARLANLSYLPEAEIGVALSAIGAEGKLVSYKKGFVDTQCLLAYTTRAAFVVFRGTEQNLSDVVTDLRYVSRAPVFKVALPGCMVHSGFHDALFNDDCWKNIMESEPMRHILERGLPVWVCGHSLGGALAILFALRLKQELAAANAKALVAAVHTFGQPRVGNPILARLIDQAFPQRYFRSINNRDIVPRVPFAVMPDVVQDGGGIDLKPIEYAHAGRVLYFDELGRALMDPPQWFRTLDTMDLGLTPEAMKEKLKEFAGDHSMVNYVRLHYALIARAPAPATSANVLPVVAGIT